MFEDLLSQQQVRSIKALDNLPPEILKQQLQQCAFPSMGLRTDSANNMQAFKQECEQIRQIAYYWPSAGVSAVMHAHVVLMMARYPDMFADSQLVLNCIEQNQSLISSLSADGSIGKNTTPSPVLREHIANQQVRLNGVKKPATLANITDYIICLSKDAQDKSSAMSLIPRSENTKAINDFWQIPVLSASDTQIVSFENVIVTKNNTIIAGDLYHKASKLAQGVFQFMHIQCYLGIAERLIDMIIQRFKPFYELRASIARINLFRASFLEVLAEQSFITDSSETARNFVRASRFTLERHFDELNTNICKHVSGTVIFSDMDYQHLMNTLTMLRYHPSSEKKFLTYFMPIFNKNN